MATFNACDRCGKVIYRRYYKVAITDSDGESIAGRDMVCADCARHLKAIVETPPVKVAHT
jgi:hypothetical protein